MKASRRECTWFWLPLAVIALHVIDDSFMQPERGTSAGDHLVSGFVPLALLAIAAAGFSQLRPGGRAALAMVMGLLGLAAGAEAVHAAISATPSRDDYSGFIAIPAAFVLTVFGSAALWRSRNNSGRRVRRYARRSCIGIVGVGVSYNLLLPVVAFYTLTHTAPRSVPQANLGTSFEEVTFDSSDGLKLTGWYIPSTNGAAVIAFPGRSSTQAHARMLARHGYGVLLFDPRGEGDSEGDPNPLGWGGDRDLTAAIAFLQARPDVDDHRIGGLGLSVGGELLLHEASQNDALRAVVSEGAGIRSVREHMETSGFARWSQLPALLAITSSVAVFSNEGPPPNLEKLVARIAPRPVFLIYSTKGTGGEHLNPKYYAAAGEPKTIWAISEGGHMGGITTHPQEYEERVIRFFDDALLGG